jgi:hypothetical protein
LTWLSPLTSLLPLPGLRTRLLATRLLAVRLLAVLALSVLLSLTLLLGLTPLTLLVAAIRWTALP